MVTQARGWSGDAKVLDNFQGRGVLLIWIIVGQGPIALAIGAGGGCLDIFSLIYHFSFLSPSLWETARYRLKYCLKGPLNPEQPTNQLHKLMLQLESCFVLVCCSLQSVLSCTLYPVQYLLLQGCYTAMSGRVAQSVGPLTLLSQRSWVLYPVWPHTFVSPSADSRGTVVSYWRKYVHEVLVNRSGDLNLPRKSVARLTDRPDMLLDVHHGPRVVRWPWANLQCRGVLQFG